MKCDDCEKDLGSLMDKKAHHVYISITSPGNVQVKKEVYTCAEYLKKYQDVLNLA